MTDILSLIVKQREARGWSESALAVHSGLPQSTISSWYRKGLMPSISSLSKVCDALDITMSQLFAVGDEAVTLTDSQRQLIDRWSRLTEEQQEAFFHLLDVI